MRALWNAPGFTATATATMALAIGSVVAIYSLYARVALHPLAVERPESLVSLYAVNASANFVPPTLSWPRFEFIAGENHRLRIPRCVQCGLRQFSGPRRTRRATFDLAGVR